MKMNKRTKEYEPSNALRLCYEWLSAAITAVVIVAVMFSGVFRIVNVSGDSMYSTLHNNDQLVLSNLFYEPEYGDIIVILREDKTPLIKRVIGLAGDRIRIDKESGIVYRQSKGLDVAVPLNEPYVYGGFTNQDYWVAEKEIPEGMIFVMGDNRMVSADSRRDGPYPLEDVVGKVYFRISPRPGLITNGE